MAPYAPVKESKSTDLARLSKPELIQYCKKIRNRLQELEKLVGLISKGKYMWEGTFDAIADPVMIVDQNYKIERANLSLAKVAGVPITEVAGGTCYTLFAGRQTPCPGCPLSFSIAQGERKEKLLPEKIRERHFEAHAYPFVDEKGRCESAVLYYRDMTSELRLRQELIQQEKMAAIGMLAGGVAHEINNPLGGVIAFTQLLLQHHSNDEMTEDLREIEKAAGRCKKIVQDLLNFSRLSKDKEKCPVDINDLLEKVVPFLKQEMRSMNVELELNLEKKLPQVTVYPDRLQQVFLNLMTNACHAMAKGGTLTLSTALEPKTGKVLVRVQDTGMGIPKELQNRVFEPFFTTKEPGKGTGLGLSVSYRIVKEHGGTLDFESEPGHGTTFVVRLPIE